MAIHVIAVSHNRLHSSNHAVANNIVFTKNAVQMLLISYTLQVELNVASHAMHKILFLNARMNLPQVILSHYTKVSFPRHH